MSTASFLIIDINADWQLAPDLLLIQSIEEVPHVLTLDEAVKLQQFFMLVAMGNLASSLGTNITLPELN